MPLIVGVDVGYINLALVSVVVSDAHEISEVTGSMLVDITKTRCLPDCQLHHSNNVVDRMNHMFALHSAVFEDADEILIEAQPVVAGLVHVEALIFSRYRQKAVLVQPTSVQSHFKWPRKQYELKKDAAVQTALPYMPQLQDVVRKHDLADAFCLILFTCQRRQVALKDELWRAARKNLGFSSSNPFQQFVCKNKLT